MGSSFERTRGSVERARGRIRISRERIEQSRRLLVRLRARLRAASRADERSRWAPPRVRHRGGLPLAPAGLVAICRGGHPWAYPVRAPADDLHEVARFNAGLACAFCLSEIQAMTEAQAFGPGSRIN